jgi:hypothetical protein
LFDCRELQHSTNAQLIGRISKQYEIGLDVEVFVMSLKQSAPWTRAPKSPNPQELNELRQKGMHERLATQQERETIETRRREIERRRQTLARTSNWMALKELLDLQLEIVKLQEHIVQLQLVSDEQRDVFTALKKSANGIWHDLSMHAEESQVKIETIQKYAEAIQKLHELLQKQEEDYSEERRQQQGR